MGAREKNIISAIKQLTIAGEITSSSLYLTEPVGYRDQNWFLNCVIRLITEKKPNDLLNLIQDIEKRLKRVRKIKNGPRTIDLDILFYKERIIKTDTLIIPHPRLHLRNFVLTPLCEIAPDFIHPIFGKTIYKLKNELKSPEKVFFFRKIEV